jgi:hypothetical protein
VDSRSTSSDVRLIVDAWSSADPRRFTPACSPARRGVAPLERRIGRPEGIDLRRTAVAPGEWASWHGGRSATPLRMALDLALDRPVPVAVADLDAVLRRRLVDLDALTDLVYSRSDRGIVDARRAVGLVDPSAESRPESQARVHLVLAGLRPVPQFWIEDGDGRVARTDLAFPERKVAVEYDGQWRDGQLWALNRDRERLNRVHAAGWDVVFVTAPLLATPRKMVAIGSMWPFSPRPAPAAAGSARSRPRSRRRSPWTGCPRRRPPRPAPRAGGRTRAPRRPPRPFR